MSWYRPQVLGLVLVVPLVSGIAVGLHGYDKVWSQLQTLWQASSLAAASTGRPVVWRASLEAVSEFARFGAGAGSHRSVYPTYLAKSVPVEFTHAESGYLQIAEELGVPGLVLLFLIGCCVLHWIRCAVPAVVKDGARREIVGPLLAAVVAAMAASFAHSLFDFVWYIPACMTMAVVLAAGLRQLALQTNSELSPLESTATHDPVWKLVSVCFLLVMVCCLPHLYHDARGQAAWEDYFTLSLASDIDQSGMTRRGRLRMTRIKADDPQVSQQMLQCLDRVLAVDDDHHLAHARKATLLLKQFDQLQLASNNAMTLSQLRDAAVASRFPTLGEQNQWLASVVQDRMPLLAAAYRHAQKAVQLSPFQGDAYVLLSELSFLTSDDADAKNAFLRQAALVRPQDGRVLLAMGQDAALQGNLETALSHWKQAFHQGVEFRQTLTSLLGNVLAAEDFMQHFQPTYAQLSDLAEFYFAQGQTAEAIVVLEQQVRLAISDTNDDDKSESDVGSVWTELAAAFRQMGRPDRAATMTLKALDRDPYAYDLRRQLAMDLLHSGQRDTGMEYVRWCLNQRPSDHELRSVLADSLRIRDDRQVSQASYLLGEEDSHPPARLPRRP
ncbi:MAG: O-antigen ligase family protein [Pirellulaceae bacterium]